MVRNVRRRRSTMALRLEDDGGCRGVVAWRIRATRPNMRIRAAMPHDVCSRNRWPMESGEVTRLLRAYSDGDRGALDRLVPLVYTRLKGMARAQLRDEGRRPLDTTALVHEAYIRLADSDTLTVEDRSHFLSIAARAMRRILVDQARRRRAQKRGGGAQLVTLDSNGASVGARVEDLLALDEALERLSELSPRQGAVVEYRVFADMTIEETARVLDVSPRTVKRDWQSARAWLNRELRQ
jgi:RNA polymerase sigma factor (TIGR02999 family)